MLLKKIMNSFNSAQAAPTKEAPKLNIVNKYAGKTLGTQTNPERAITSLEQLGRTAAAYCPTHIIEEPFINEYHRSLTTAPLGRLGIAICVDLGIDGYLQRDDTLKIYELAYFSSNDILELGTHKGLSTSIIARAIHESGSKNRLVTVDIDASAVKVAKSNIANIPGKESVDFNVSDATAFMDQLIKDGRKFGFVFVDHWHGYEATHEAAVRLPQLLEKGGFALFHDYNDPDNANPEHAHKVYQAVADTLVKDPNFEFCTISGCTALFRKISD